MGAASPFQFVDSPISLKSSSDLSAKIGYYAKLSSGGWAVADSAGMIVEGAIMDTEVDGKSAVAVETSPGKVVPMKAGSAGVTQDREITTDASGQPKDAGANDWTRARALKTAAQDEWFPALLTSQYKKANAAGTLG